MSRKYRRFKRILGVSTILLALLIVNLPMVSFAETPSAGSDFVIENGVLTKYTGSGGDVVIPDGVTSIGDRAFEGCSNLSSVTIPESVTSIGSVAFGLCSNLSSVTIPESVTSIGFSAFSGCSNLSSVTIPESVTSIGVFAFSGTPWLESKRQERTDHLVIINDILIDGEKASGNIVIPNGVTSIGGFAFSGRSNLSSVTIPESVTSIEDKAFLGCESLSCVEILSSVTSIGDAAFYQCSNLSSVTIPESVTSIGGSAFSGTPWLESKRQERTDHLVIINDILIDGEKASGNIVIPNGVTKISRYAFVYCVNLTSIVIPQSVTYIDNWTFAGCENLLEMSILNPNTKLGHSQEYPTYTTYEYDILDFGDGPTDFKSPIVTIKGYSNSTAQRLFDHYRGDTRFQFVALDGTDDGGNDDTPTPIVINDKRTNKENSTAISATVTNSTEALSLSVEDSAGVTMNSLITLSNGMSLKAYDLKLVNASGEAVADFGSCTITLPIPSSMDVSNGTVQAMAVKTDGTLERFDTETIDVNGVKCARFTTTHFSEYALVYTPNADNGSNGGNTGGNTGNGGNDNNGGNGGNTGNDGSTGNNNGNTGNDNAGIQGSTDNTSNPDNVTPPANAASTTPARKSPATGDRNNAKDMPKTGEGDEIKMLIAVSLFLFGCIEIISSISVRKKVRVRR